jgi:hypothetical protein
LTVAKRKNPPSESGTVVHLHTGGGGSGDSQHVDDDEMQQLDAMEDGALSRAIEDIRTTEGASAEVLRIAPAEKMGRCRTYPISLFSQDRVGNDYGPGKYRVKFKGPGDKYIKGGGTFSIAEGINLAPPPGGGVSEVLALFKAERERDEADRAKRKGEWLEWAKLLAPLMAPKILDLIGGGSKGPSIRDLVATMKDMKDLQAPAQNLTTQFSEVINILQGAKDLVGDDGGRPSTASTGATLVDLLRDFIQSPAMGALASAIPGFGGQTAALPSPAFPAGPALAAPPVPAVNSGSAPATAANCSPPGTQGPDVLAQLNWLRHTLTQLLVQANKQANPRLYAEVVLDNLPPFIEPKALLARLEADGWWAELQQVDGRIAPLAPWFLKFRNYSVRLLHKRTDPPDVPDQPRPMQEGEGEFE